MSTAPVVHAEHVDITSGSPVTIGTMPWTMGMSRWAQIAFQGGPLLVMMTIFPLGLAMWDYRQTQQFDYMRQERREEFQQLREEIKESRAEARTTRTEFTLTLRNLESEFRNSIKDLSLHDTTERGATNLLMRELIGEVRKLQTPTGPPK